MAYITTKGKIKHLGYFTSEQTAAEVYNKAAREEYGEFAYLNQILKSQLKITQY